MILPYMGCEYLKANYINQNPVQMSMKSSCMYQG